MLSRPMLSRPNYKAIAALTVTLCLPLAAAGQAQRSSGGDGNRANQQLMQLSAERTAAQAEAATAKQQLADAQKELATLKAERDGLRGRLSTLESQRAKEDGQTKTLSAELEASRQALANGNRLTRDQTAELRAAETTVAQLRNSVATYDRDYEVCAKHNLELTDIARDALHRYEHVGLTGYLARAEPFTHLSQTRVENLSDEYRLRIAKLALQHGEHPVSPTSPAAQQ